MVQLTCKSSANSEELSCEFFDSCINCDHFVIEECIPYCSYEDEEDMYPIDDLEECPKEAD